LKKNINQITFYFAEEGPGRGSEDIKKECNVNQWRTQECYSGGGFNKFS
jgi:hypothetical protein